ncbi:MAG: 1-acyl-sn-glycerol-3-phosphate acyltransferase [Chitinispirillaceae bacterium]|nr:1-acyl-sn-glycerol-3-phosphate acyltransferase [Chitinispirillaceae bacterium]
MYERAGLGAGPVVYSFHSFASGYYRRVETGKNRKDDGTMASHHESVAGVAGNVDRFLNHAFTSIVIDGPQLDPEEIQRHPHMIVSTHRSHVDYFLAGWFLFYQGFKHMRFAAGSNLTNLPWIGPRFRAFGAFTVEREKAFERNYIQNLCNQVIGMMENREAVILFPEGGRSYSGAMLDLKGGILGAAVVLQARHPDDDVYLIPSAISYECPPDAPWFELLLRGKTLRKRNNNFAYRLLGNAYYFGADLFAFLPFVTSRRTGRRYGSVYVDHGAPLSVRSMVDLKALEAPDARDEFFRHRAAMQKVGEIMHAHLLSLFRLLPLHALAALLVKNGPLDAAHAVALVPGFLDEMRAGKRNSRSLDALSPHDIVAAGREQLLRLGAVHINGGVFFEKNGSLLRYCAAAAQAQGGETTR